MEISFKRSPTLSLMISRVGRTFLLIPITIIPLTPMLTPRPHTNPAEFIGTFPTSHMITSAVLFDRRVAPTTFLGIGGDPVGRFGIVFAFLEPSSNEWAETGLVVRQGAPEAETVAAAAADGGHDMV
jgi:hypothetical protein